MVALAREMGATCIKAHKMDAGRALALPPSAATTAADAAAAGGAGSGGGQGAAAAVHADSAKGTSGSSAYSGQRQELQPGQQQPGQQQPLSDKARLREERRRANMLRRGITPPEPAAAGEAPRIPHTLLPP
mgnify:CR=1 FL=1